MCHGREWNIVKRWSIKGTYLVRCATRCRKMIASSMQKAANVCETTLIGEILYTLASNAQQVLDQLKTAPVQTRPIPGHRWVRAHDVRVPLCLRRCVSGDNNQTSQSCSHGIWTRASQFQYGHGFPNFCLAKSRTWSRLFISATAGNRGITHIVAADTKRRRGTSAVRTRPCVLWRPSAPITTPITKSERERSV